MTGSSANGQMDAGVSRKRVFAVLRRPLFFTVVNFFFLNTIFAFLPYRIGDVLSTAGRIFIVGYAGWLICRRNIGGIRHAALVGAGMYFIDHVVLKGGVFIVNYLFNPEGMGLAAFSSVVISFVFLSPIACALGAAGGAIARSQAARLTADQR